MQEIEALNRTLFLLINGGASTPPWLVGTAYVIAEWLIYLLPALMLVFWLWGDHGRRGLAVKALLATLLALGINQIIALFWMHPRPFMIGLGHAWLDHVPDSSFPSDHGTVFAAVGLALLLGGATRLAVVVLGTGLAVAWSRIFLGVHYPFDMLGAVAISAVACIVIEALWRRVGEALLGAAERLYRVIFARLIAAGWVRL
jgi:undecaprenyl-diphosphatase